VNWRDPILLAATSAGPARASIRNGLDSITCRGAPAKCAVAFARSLLRCKAVGNWFRPGLARGASAEHSRWCRALRVSASSVATRGAAAGPVGSEPRGTGGDTWSQRLGDGSPAVGICTLTAPTRGGFVDSVPSSPPTVDGEGRRTSVRRRTSPAAGVSLRCELGRGRTRRPAVVAHQLRPTGVLSRCARSRLAGTLAPSGGRLRGPRSVGVDAARREDLGAVAPIFSGLRFGVRVRPRRDASNANRSGQRRRGGNIAYAPASFCYSFLRCSRGLSRSNLTVDAGSSVRGRERPGVRSEVNALVARGHARVTLREPLRVATPARFSASSSPVRAETLQAGGMRSSLYASPRAREDSCGEAIRRNGLTV
jgi:hypothetical protein